MTAAPGVSNGGRGSLATREAVDRKERRVSDTSRQVPSIGGPYAALRVVRECSRATGPARAVLTVLATYADGSGLAWPSLAQIARDAGLGRSTIQRALRQLEGELFEIRVDLGTGRGKASEYRIRLVDLIERHAQAVDNPVIPGIDEHVKGPGLTPFRHRKGPAPAQKGPRSGTPSTKEQPRGDARGRCPAHATVENPPPCIACRDARLAADAADEEAAKRARHDEARRRVEEQLARREAPKPPPASREAIERARLAARPPRANPS